MEPAIFAIKPKDEDAVIEFTLDLPALSDPDVEARREVFHAKAKVPAWMLIEMDAIGAVPAAVAAARYLDFFAEVIPPEDQQRWLDVVKDRRYAIDVQELNSIWLHLAEVYSGRPTVRAES